MDSTKKDCFVVVCLVLWSLCNAPREWETSVGAGVGHGLVSIFNSTQKHVHHMELTKSEHECHIPNHAYCHLNNHLLFGFWSIWCSLCFHILSFLFLQSSPDPRGPGRLGVCTGWGRNIPCGWLRLLLCPGEAPAGELWIACLSRHLEWLPWHAQDIQALWPQV